MVLIREGIEHIFCVFLRLDCQEEHWNKILDRNDEEKTEMD